MSRVHDPCRTNHVIACYKLDVFMLVINIKESMKLSKKTKTSQLISFCFFDDSLTVRLEDHVLIKGERTGFVRFIGHLEKSSLPNTVYVGLHLDVPGNV